jgi:hypothetical protein
LGVLEPARCAADGDARRRRRRHAAGGVRRGIGLVDVPRGGRLDVDLDLGVAYELRIFALTASSAKSCSPSAMSKRAGSGTATHATRAAGSARSVDALEDAFRLKSSVTAASPWRRTLRSSSSPSWPVSSPSSRACVPWAVPRRPARRGPSRRLGEHVDVGRGVVVAGGADVDAAVVVEDPRRSVCWRPAAPRDRPRAGAARRSRARSAAGHVRCHGVDDLLLGACRDACAEREEIGEAK